MQDNFTNIDRKFTDRAWKEMSKMLDKEMPVSQPRKSGWKRYLLLLLFLGIGIGVVFGIKALFFDSEPVVEPTKVERAVADADENESKEIKTPLQAKIPERDETITVVAGQNSDKEENLETSIAITEKNNPEINLTIEEPIIENTRNDESNNNVATNTEINEPIFLKILPYETKEDNQKETTSSIASHIASLSINKIEYEESAELDFDELPAVKSKRKIFNPRSIKVRGNGIFHPIRTIDGIGGALLAEYDLKNPKFGIETGVGFDYLVSNPIAANKNLAIFGRSDAEFADETTNSFQLIDETSEDFSVPVSVEENYIATATQLEDTTLTFSLLSFPVELHYFKLPFEVFYKVGSRWRISGGLNFALLLSSPNSTTGGILNGTNAKSANTSIVGATNEAYNNISSTTNVPIRKIDLAASIGINYLLSKNFEAGFRYNQGLIDHFNLENLNSHNRYFQLSLAYKFNMNK